MRWWGWVLVAVAALVVVSVAVGLLWPKSPNVGDRTKLTVTYTAENAHRLDTVTVTRAELAAATCTDGSRCWVAVDGVVYDLAGVEQWRRGRHHGVKAGTDATSQFVGSPHAKDHIERLPVVGRLAA